MSRLAIRTENFRLSFKLIEKLRLKSLEFEVIDVRPAEDSEVAHGHVHGPGGVEHKDDCNTEVSENPSCKPDKSCCGPE